MSGPRWLKVRYRDVALNTRPPDAEWALESASPYDVPSELRAQFDEIAGRALLEFRYITDEPEETIWLDEHRFYRVGKKTRRLRAVNVDLLDSHGDIRGVLHAFKRSIANLSPRETSNRKIAVRALKDKEQSLFGLISPDLAVPM